MNKLICTAAMVLALLFGQACNGASHEGGKNNLDATKGSAKYRTWAIYYVHEAFPSDRLELREGDAFRLWNRGDDANPRFTFEPLRTLHKRPMWAPLIETGEAELPVEEVGQDNSLMCLKLPNGEAIAIWTGRQKEGLLSIFALENGNCEHEGEPVFDYSHPGHAGANN